MPCVVEQHETKQGTYCNLHFWFYGRHAISPNRQFFHHLPVVFGPLVSWMHEPSDLTISMVLNNLVPLSKLMAEQITAMSQRPDKDGKRTKLFM